MMNNIYTAKKDDLQNIKSILKNASLPFEDIEHVLNGFLLLKVESVIIGTVCLEKHDSYGFLRSLAVISSKQKKGYGNILYDAVIEKARNENIYEIYLLTETADTFFRKKGFTEINRKDVPQPIRNTSEFSYLCPDSAICMKLEF